MTTLDYTPAVIDDQADPYDIPGLWLARCVGGPTRPNCTNERRPDSGFCDECHAAMHRAVEQPAPPAPTTCPEPCGAPLAPGTFICPACEAEHAPKAFSDLATTLLPNGNLHIRLNGLTAFCGSVALARQLRAALNVALGEQADLMAAYRAAYGQARVELEELAKSSAVWAVERRAA